MAESNRALPDRLTTRRDFLGRSAATALGTAVATASGPLRRAHGGASQTLKIGLIGCGGRGSGAAINALRADPDLQLTALADLFPDQLEKSRRNIQSSAEGENLGHKFAVNDDHCFTGFDAGQRLLETDVDVVILAETPHFRPRHLEAAVAAGKHVFCEKPVAVDGPGVRKVLASVAEAERKGLNIVSGLCWRYDPGMRETVGRVLDGAVGDLIAIHTNYLTGTLWHRGRKPEWSEMEYQIRNWLYFTWLSGDHIVEQHVHSLDKALWLMGDELPASCFGLGGRQVRTGDEWGNIYDHHAVCYEYDQGVKVFAYTRQMSSCYNQVEDFVLGTKGQAELISYTIRGQQPWKYDGPRPSMYDVEHEELFAAIRSGKPINNGLYMARSTLLAIMGRMACYTGQRITADAALNSQEDFSLPHYEFTSAPNYPVPLPGVTDLA